MLLTLLAACSGSEDPPDPPASTASTAETAETGSDSGGTDTAAAPVGEDLFFEAGDVLVVPHTDGVHFLEADGAVRLARTWGDLVGPCVGCAGEGASADGDGLLVSFTEVGPGTEGGVARLGPGLALDFRVSGLSFPHDAVRDPGTDQIVVPESSLDRLVWIAPTDGEAVPLAVLDGTTPGWPGDRPNGAERFTFEGRTFLLVSHRGGAAAPPDFGLGSITLWDLTVPGDPAHVWTFPSSGGLDTPHAPSFRWFGGQFWLIYAHSRGLAPRSTVGLAVTDDPRVRPSYVADLVASPSGPAFDFLRGVELTTDGVLYLTDSAGSLGSSAGDYAGRVLRGPMPEFLVPRGGSGSATFGEQVFEELETEELLGGLDNPFEGWIWKGAQLTDSRR